MGSQSIPFLLLAATPPEQPQAPMVVLVLSIIHRKESFK
jgi:hypothetical protein